MICQMPLSRGAQPRLVPLERCIQYNTGQRRSPGGLLSGTGEPVGARGGGVRQREHGETTCSLSWTGCGGTLARWPAIPAHPQCGHDGADRIQWVERGARVSVQGAAGGRGVLCQGAERGPGAGPLRHRCGGCPRRRRQPPACPPTATATATATTTATPCVAGTLSSYNAAILADAHRWRSGG